MPPDRIFEPDGPCFMSDPDLMLWIRAAFIDPGGQLENEDHQHLQMATIGCLWTAKSKRSKMLEVIGQAEIPQPQGDTWARARAMQQFEEWFGYEPDFVLTFNAFAAVTLDDPSFCALVEHELYHCAQDRDQWGTPKFRKADGKPVFAIRGHDVEEFVGVVRRYGVNASGQRLKEMVDAANAGPTIERAFISGACGTCGAGV
jgi:hypothetical protein